MTFAEKLTQIAENEQKVYDAGFEKGKASGGSGYDEGFADGKQAEYDAFWDVYQVSGNEPSPQPYIFAGFGWDDVSFNPKYDICLSGYCVSVFAGCKITDLKGNLERLGKKLDTSRATNLGSFMYDAKTITTVPTLDLRGVTGGDSICRGAVGLVTIEKIILKEDGTTPVGYLMYNCPALENVVIEGVIGNTLNLQHDVKLTRASIESIVNHLSDTTSGKTLTLSKTAADTAFPCWWDNPQTGQRENVGCSGNGEWIDLRDRKLNWTITLV